MSPFRHLDVMKVSLREITVGSENEPSADGAKLRSAGMEAHKLMRADPAELDGCGGGAGRGRGNAWRVRSLCGRHLVQGQRQEIAQHEMRHAPQPCHCLQRACIPHQY